MDVMAEIQPIGKLFKDCKYLEALAQLDDLWGRIPEPKTTLINSYMVVAYGAIIAQKANNMDRAWQWAQRALPYSGNVNLGGESEFLVGEVAYARGDKLVAKNFFKITKKMSGKRLFKDKNPEYLELTKD